MSAGWVLQPVTQVAILGAALGVGLIGSLALWVSVKTEARAARKADRAFRAAMESTIAELRVRIEEARTLPACDPSPPVNLMAVQGMNLTARTKALRMHRRGETPSGIAAALGVSQEEVELLLKLDQLLREPAA